MTGYSQNRQPFDIYPTPSSVTVGLLDNEIFEGSILEPASGSGNISKVLEEYYPDRHIISSDIRTEGVYGLGGIDFLKQTAEFYNYPENIITNPPYRYATEFVIHAKEIASQKVAMLLKLNALAGLDRYKKIWRDRQFPLKKVILLVKRPDFSQKNSPALEYCWVVWEKFHLGAPVIQWFNNANIK